MLQFPRLPSLNFSMELKKVNTGNVPRYALDKFLLPLNIIDMDRSAAIEAAAIRAQLEKKENNRGRFYLIDNIS